MVQTAAAPAGRGGEEAPHDPDRGTETGRPAKEVSVILQTSCHIKLCLICVRNSCDICVNCVQLLSWYQLFMMICFVIVYIDHTCIVVGSNIPLIIISPSYTISISAD